MKKILIAIDKISGTLFDDFVGQDVQGLLEKWQEVYDKDTWTQVCDKCATEHNLPKNKLEEVCSESICGVLGCNNESDYYYDFNREEKEFKQHV